MCESACPSDWNQHSYRARWKNTYHILPRVANSITAQDYMSNANGNWLSNSFLLPCATKKATWSCIRPGISCFLSMQLRNHAKSVSWQLCELDWMEMILFLIFLDLSWLPATWLATSTTLRIQKHTIFDPYPIIHDNIRIWDFTSTQELPTCDFFVLDTQSVHFTKYQCPMTTTNLSHSYSFIINHYQSLSFIIIHYHSLSFIVIHYHSLSLSFIIIIIHYHYYMIYNSL
jgi:hypothetical protein